MKKRALVLCSKTGFGGAERRFLRIYSALNRQGNRYTILFQASRKPDALELMRKMEINPAEFREIKCFFNRRQLVAECIFGGYELLHFVDVSILWTAITILAKIVGIKTISTIASVFLGNGSASVKLKALAFVQWSCANHIDLLYPFYKDNITRYHNSQKITCTPGTFTDLQLFQPAHKEKILLFCAARLSSEKNPLLLVDALIRSAMEIRQKGYKVVIAGRDYYETLIKAKIQQAGIGDFTQTPGYVAPQEYIRKAQVVFSLQTPNYPSQVVAEACASGCCVIATKCTQDPPTFLNDSFTIFCDKDCNSLADAIRLFLSLDEDKKRELGQNARAHAEKHFSVENSVAYFQNIIENL